MSMHMPPLRERQEDIPLLADHFLRRFCTEFGKEPKSVAPSLMQRLVNYPWRGNVRELENVISRAVLLSADTIIQAEDLQLDLDSVECLVTERIKGLPYKHAKASVLERFNREYLTDLLARNHGNVTKAAQACGLERQALQQVLRRYGIKSCDFQPSEDRESVLENYTDSQK